MPTTPRALAWLASEHTSGTPTTPPTATTTSRTRGEGGVDASLRFGTTGEYDGDLGRG